MISGLPPQRLYVHPDEQIELLQKQKAEGKTGLPDLPREREWVLPSHLREKWSLRKFGEVFDSIAIVPSKQDGTLLFDDEVDDGRDSTTTQTEGADEATDHNRWRMLKPKRLLLATLDDDSTIAYYIVHDGIVKPRQN
jgi:tRNA-splicing endonuclease subunit Sen15